MTITLESELKQCFLRALFGGPLHFSYFVKLESIHKFIQFIRSQAQLRGTKKRCWVGRQNVYIKICDPWTLSTLRTTDLNVFSKKVMRFVIDLKEAKQWLLVVYKKNTLRILLRRNFLWHLRIPTNWTICNVVMCCFHQTYFWYLGPIADSM